VTATIPAAATERPAFAGLPAGAGLGAKPQHVEALLADAAGPAFIEVHAENYMGAGGPPHHWLRRLRERYPLSLHGVGLSIGGESPLDEAHLDRLAGLVARYEPAQFSEHLAWSSHGGTSFNDLLPLRYDRDSLERVLCHLDRLQTRLRRRVLLENPSTYVEFEGGDFDEAQFLAEIVRRSGCGLLLDLNNAYVSACNHGRDVAAYLAALPLDAVGEVHLAGHARDRDAAGAPLLVDDHGSAVAAPVWDLFERVVRGQGRLPTLIEWDTDVPAYAALMAQARQADARLDARRSAA
jgi:uncharacterized protein (UPF0276 family)